MTETTQSLREELENAPEVGEDDPSARFDGDPGPGDDDDRPKGSRPRGTIWDGCPVTPLGVYGKSSYYLDVRGQLIEVGKHDIETIRHLFGGRIRLLATHFPPAKRGNKSHFDQAAAATAMCQASDEVGIFNPSRNLRGPGLWSDDDGKLIYHAGDQVLIDGDWHPPGRYDGKTYGAAEPIPRPAPHDGRLTPAEELLPFFGRWEWRRPDIDPHLVLGVCGVQIAGGALAWRPTSWITGDAAHGKSTLLEAILALHGGDTGMIQTSDATKAGILSQVGYSCLPVSVDELEPSDQGSQREKDIIQAARIASSGGQFVRGSADHKGHSGNVYSAFLFSSILIPPMRAQDLSRLIKLDLDRLPDDAERIVLDRRKMRRIGAQIRRRIVDGWPTWAERLELWRVALGREGIGGRQADNYGTVLAMQDMLLHDDLPKPDMLGNWAEKLAACLTTDEDDEASNAGDMLTWLLSQPLDIWRRGRKHTVAEFLAWAAALPGTQDSFGEATERRQANQLLGLYGLRVKGRGETAVLEIANKPFGPLKQLFEGSQWAEGVWKQAAERVPGAQRGVNRTFARQASRATAIPFTALPGMLAFPDKAGVRADQARSTSPAAPQSPDLDDIG